jgi:phage terminase large subunit
MLTRPDEKPNDNRVIIPYNPRKHFIGLHQSKKRFKFVVAHRRAGKSVAEINEVIKQALQNERQYPPPRYAYVGPSFTQTKDLIWGYAKHYTGVFANMDGYGVSEGDLQIRLPNTAIINLYGGAGAYERMRGLYFDGIVLDEFPLLNPAVFSTVVRPCLADYRGWAVVSGTSNGDDHFHELKKRVENDPDWDVHVIPVTDTDALHPDEVVEMTKDMTPEEYAREMLCSFEAPIEGAYYAALINEAQANGRICSVPHDPNAPVFTWWDLGIDDAMAIWFIQRVGRELHVIDYQELTGKGLADTMSYVRGHEKGYERRKKYNFTIHVMPADIKARELGTGKSRYEVMLGLTAANETVFVAPGLSVEDGISAARSVIPMCYFDETHAAQGISVLRNYHRNPKTGRPVHNWASHGSDGFRIGAVALNQTIGYISSSNVLSMGRLRRRIRGVV